MPSAEARYTGDKKWENLPDFKDSLKSALHALFLETINKAPQASSATHGAPLQVEQGFKGDADNFVEAILAEARFAIPEVYAIRYALTKREIVAELRNLKRSIKSPSGISQKLRALSTEVDILLGSNADPKGLADLIDGLTSDQFDEYRANISDLLARLTKAEQAVHTSEPKKKKPTETMHTVAVEMALRVLRVLNRYGIAASATAGKYLKVREDCYVDGTYGESTYISPAVEVLKLIGRDIRLVFTETTWRDIIIEAKAKAPDIK